MFEIGYHICFVTDHHCRDAVIITANDVKVEIIAVFIQLKYQDCCCIFQF